jgi:flagellar basal body-associated protein FliL
MNCSKAQHKTSKVTAKAGFQIFLILILQVVMATVAALFGTLWVIQNKNADYLESSSDPNAKLKPILLFF